MKMMIVVALAFLAIASAALQYTEPIKIILSDYVQQPEGGYNYNFETENGITRNENGELKQTVDEENKPKTVLVVRGEYGYTDPEGNPQVISYSADETGFHANGPSIPKTTQR